MSWINQVKFFYTTTITLMVTFIWTAIISALFRLNITFELFFIVFIGSNIARYLLRRGTNPKVCLFIGMLPIVIVEFIISNEPLLAIFNITFSSIFILKILKDEISDVNYQDYKREFIRGIYYIFIASIGYSIIRSGLSETSSSIYVVILAYVILVVITLREAMGYECNIKRSKVSKIINCSLGAFGILLTQDFVYSKLVFLAKIIKQVINYIFLFIVEGLLAILKYPITLLFSLIEKILAGLGNEAMLQILEDMGKVEETEPMEVVRSLNGENPIIFNILKIGLLILVIYLFFKAASKIYYKINENRNREYTEVIESIERDINKSEKLKSKLKKLFRKKGSPREEIIYKYGEVVEAAAKKDIFKKYMTPSQLKHVIKIKMRIGGNIEVITELYNEAKFSTHNIEKDKQNKMVENVNNLKKTMK